MSKTKSKHGRTRDNDWGTLKKPKHSQDKMKLSNAQLKKLTKMYDEFEDFEGELQEEYR
jgi:hypothetical protein